MNYWLEKTYPSNRTEGDFTSLLLSPTHNASGANIYANMKKVTTGDIVFHLDQDTNSLVGYSEAADNYNIIQLNGEDFLSVDLRHFEALDIPINIDVFLSKDENQDTLARVKRRGQVFYQNRYMQISLYSSTRFTFYLPLFQPSNKHLRL